MGLFDALFGGNKKETVPVIDVAKIKEDIKLEMSSEIVKENELLRQDLAHEIKKIHERMEDVEKKARSGHEDAQRIEDISAAVGELNKKFSDLCVMGKLSIANREQVEILSQSMATKEDIEALRNEVLNVVPTIIDKDANEVLENVVQTEPKMPLEYILERLPKSRRVLVNILMEAESPISYKQIATKMGLTYNTVKVYVRDVRESGFPIEEYMAQNKKLLNIPNSVKAAMIYNQSPNSQY
ncbi:MAG: hypothetical protein DRN71_05580 [Candidatus Nanohalarchaeota archaeon]|nr:MAG: hypothetical protein DRN71_05580 [Candidatus Nanohaloarchaeota archaeon]